MSPKQNFFIIEVLTPEDTWTQRIRINNENDWDSVFEEYIKKYMEFLDNK
jgi:hypothetical protein